MDHFSEKVKLRGCVTDCASEPSYITTMTVPVVDSMTIESFFAGFRNCHG
jgi:hypothetical protein